VTSDTALRPPHTDWLRHVLTVSGPATTVAAFRDAAMGAGAIPWHLDLDHEAARLLAPMATAGADARVLAHELRDAVAAHHARVLAQIARGGVCPLDLHRLIPVPQRVLRLGPDDPASQLWLWQHWGTPQPLRHVRVLDRQTDRRLRRSARFVVEFFAADWTPWPALVRLRQDWALVFAIRPEYGDG
jgi:hypothetical protein